MNDTTQPRFGALDLFRGITIASMIVVNNPGNWNSVFPQLTHAAWNGVTFADMIFPTFIFIMGVAMSVSLRPRAHELDRLATYRRIARRALLLVVMGLVLNLVVAWPAPAGMRIPGVLQRIGITYFVAALIMLNATSTQQWAVAAGLLLVHWATLALAPGWAFNGSVEPGVNTAASLDRWLFGSHTLTPSGDPEGALGLLSTVATALFGVAAGRLLQRDTTKRQAGDDPKPIGALAFLAVAGCIAIGTGYVWSFVLPLNKSLWTGSFAVAASGAAALSLVACAYVDRPRSRRFTMPLAWLGTNPLAVYFLSELTTSLVQRPWLMRNGHAVAPKDVVYWSWIVPFMRDNGGRSSSLVYAASYTLLWIAFAGVLRWRGVRLRV